MKPEYPSRTDLHHRIGAYIKSHSQAKFPKKHGSWHVYYVTPTLWFFMDDFNSAISLHWGEGSPKDAPACAQLKDENRLVYLGIDFGGYESRLSHAQYTEIAALLR